MESAISAISLVRSLGDWRLPLRRGHGVQGLPCVSPSEGFQIHCPSCENKTQLIRSYACTQCLRGFCQTCVTRLMAKKWKSRRCPWCRADGAQFKPSLEGVQELKGNTALYDLSLQLCLFRSDIAAIETTDKQLIDAPTKEALVRLLEGCRRQLEELEPLLKKVISRQPSSRFRTIKQGLQINGNDRKIRQLVGTLEGYKSSITVHLAARQHRILHSDNNILSTTSFFEVPVPKVSHFIGRDIYIGQITSIFDRGDTNPAIVVLLGVGGQGKTQIALEFCRRSSSKYRAIFWINASAEDCVVRGFERIAKLCMPHVHLCFDSQDGIESVKNTLREWPVPWLLVFDNYDAPRSFPNLSSFFPIGCCRNQNAILITSRQASCRRLGHGIEVNGLAEEEAIDLLQCRSHVEQFTHEELAEGRKIVKQLGYLALAIDQAGAYIASCQLPLSHFADHYERRKEHILNNTPETLWEYQSLTESCTRSSGANLGVLTTWELSLQQISQDKAEQRKLKSFLSQASFFDPVNVKESLFRYCWEDPSASRHDWMSLFSADGLWDSDRFQDTLAHLKNLSLIHAINITAQECKFALHPMIKEWLQLRAPLEVRKVLVHSAMSMAATLVEKEDSESLTIYPRQELLGTIDCCLSNAQYHLKKLDDRVAYGGFVEGYLTTFAIFYGRHGRFTDSEKAFLHILNYPWVHGQTTVPCSVLLRTLNNLSLIRPLKKDLANALVMLQKTLDKKKELLDGDDPMMTSISLLERLCILEIDVNETKVTDQNVLAEHSSKHLPDGSILITELDIS